MGTDAPRPRLPLGPTADSTVEASMTGQGRTSRRGDGHPHQQIRRQVKRIVDAGRAVCWRCHRPIHPAEPWASAMSTATSPDTQDPSIDGATEQRQQTPRDDGQTPLGAGPRWPAPWRSSIPATNWRRRCRAYELARRAPVQQVQATAANDLSEGRRQRTVTPSSSARACSPRPGCGRRSGPSTSRTNPPGAPRRRCSTATATTTGSRWRCRW